MKGRSIFYLFVFGAVLITTPVMGAQSCSATARISPANQTVPETTNGNPTQVTLNGTPSAPQQGISYTWRQTGGPSVTLSSSTDAKPTFSAPGVGTAGATLTFELTVTGCSPAQSSSATTTINVTNVETNRPPVASAVITPDVVYEDSLVTLDGSPSSDPDGDPLTYAWTQISGPAVTLNSSDAIASFTAPNAAYPNGVSLTFRLTVSDGTLSGTTDKIVNVLWLNDPPVASLQCPASVNEGDLVTLDGSGSSDSDDGIASFAWSQIQGLPNADLSGVDLSSSSISFAAPRLTSRYNTMKFGLTVTDTRDLKSSAECDVIVLDVTPPAISGVADITAEATSASGALVNFTLTATDNVDGNVDVNCTPVSGSTFALGTNEVTCTAADTSGNTATASFKVTVQDTTPPAITYTDNLTVVATSVLGAEVTYNPVANDTVDGIVLVTCSPASGSTFPIGMNTVSCSATDSHSNTASASFGVTVKYGFIGPLSPYGPGKAYKIKSTIPIKWQYTSSTGAVLPSSTARPTVIITKVADSISAEDAIALDDSGISGYQYDSLTNTWQFNWKTTGLTGGTYYIWIKSNATGQLDCPYPAQLTK